MRKSGGHLKSVNQASCKALTHVCALLLSQARAAHTAELTSRTELVGILRQCVEDVRVRHQAVREGGSGRADVRSNSRWVASCNKVWVKEGLRG